MTDEDLLAIRVRSKVRDQYGKDTAPEPEEPPKLLGVEVADVKDLPKGLIKKIYRQAMVDPDVQSFVVVLEINGARVHVQFAVSGVSLSIGRQSGLKQVIKEMLGRSGMAIREVVDRALQEDLRRYIENGGTDWIEFKW